MRPLQKYYEGYNVSLRAIAAKQNAYEISGGNCSGNCNHDSSIRNEQVRLDGTLGVYVGNCEYSLKMLQLQKLVVFLSIPVVSGGVSAILMRNVCAERRAQLESRSHQNPRE